MGRPKTGRPRGRPKNPENVEPGDYSGFKVNQSWVRKAYEDWAENEDECTVPESVWKQIREHWKKRPLDRLWMGVLKIETKEEGLQWFNLKAEQREYLEWFEAEYNAKLPIRSITLKARQIGFSTLCSGILYCLGTVPSANHSKAHIVADIIERCDGQVEMFNTFHAHEPDHVRPEKSQDSMPIVFDDDNVGVQKSRLYYESAERRSRAGRSFTFLRNHFTEIAFWPPSEQAAIINSLKKSVPSGPGSVIMEESTGNIMQDIFYTRYFQAKEGKLGDYKSFFFPWFAHEEYRKPLPKSMTAEEYRATLTQEDVLMWDTYNLKADQVYWYVTQRDEEVTGEGSTYDLFKREYPCNEQEAFIGANSSFFEPSRNKTDIARTETRKQLPVEMARLPVSTSRKPEEGQEKPRIAYAKCELITDFENLCKNPLFIDNKMGNWTIWELPRKGHEYVISADSSRGIMKEKNVKSSSDFDVIDIWRITYEAFEQPAFVQVAQFRAQSFGVYELAHQSVAASVVYGDRINDSKAFFIGENNAHGLAMLEESKRLNANLYVKRMFGKYGEEISREIGFMTTAGKTAQGSKNAILTAFRMAWNRDMVIVNSGRTALEMGTFANNNGILEAIPPNHDDTVTVGAMFIEAVRELKSNVAPILIATKEKSADDDDEEDIPKPLKRRSYKQHGGVYEGINELKIDRWGYGTDDGSPRFGI